MENGLNQEQIQDVIKDIDLEEIGVSSHDEEDYLEYKDEARDEGKNPDEIERRWVNIEYNGPRKDIGFTVCFGNDNEFLRLEESEQGRSADDDLPIASGKNPKLLEDRDRSKGGGYYL